MTTGAAGEQRCDVVVVGGGPAGSTAAALLARRGRDVVVLEKDHHPRFHIGESLLPANLPIFERLGIAEAVRDLGVFKPGAEFVSDEHGKCVVYLFADGTGETPSYSFQVRRAEFDKLLIDTCASAGARVFEGVRALRVETGTEGARVECEDEAGRASTWHARYVLDASGRDTLLAKQHDLKTSNKHNDTAAVFAHFEGVERREGAAEGVISIHFVERGWFWVIPLRGGVTSVGLVGDRSLFASHKGAPEELFANVVASSAQLARRMSGARRVSPFTSTGNYSYSARTAVGERHMLIGDAFAFVDPIFSSGVLLAMGSAERAAAAVDVFLDDPGRGRAMLMRAERETRRQVTNVSWFIYRIRESALRDLFMNPRDLFGVRRGITTLLAGCFAPAHLSPRQLIFRAIYYAFTLLGRFGIRPLHGAPVVGGGPAE